MDRTELEQVVDILLGKRPTDGAKPFELLSSIHRKRFPAEFLPVLEPLLHIKKGATYKYAIDIIGKLKGASIEASKAVEAAWERSWEHGVPQACDESFRALLRIGDNDERLLAMIRRTLEVDNYGIHKTCAETLMKIEGGDSLLANWSVTPAGQCDCHLHQKLADKVAKHNNN